MKLYVQKTTAFLQSVATIKAFRQIYDLNSLLVNQSFKQRFLLKFPTLKGVIFVEMLRIIPESFHAFDICLRKPRPLA